MTRQKVIKFIMTEEEFPMLFKLESDILADTCYDLLKTGYNNSYNGPNHINPSHNKILNSIDIHTGCVRNDLHTITNKLNNINIEDQVDNLNNIVDELFGISNNSSKKGKLSEELIYKILQNKFKDYVFENTTGKPHHGDILVDIPNKERIMVEIKNYTRTVDTTELTKLKYDMTYTGIKYSLFISLQTGFTGRKRMEILEFDFEGDNYYILFVPNIMDEISKIESGLIVLERIIDLNTTKNIKLNVIQSNISEYLNELDNVIDDFTKLKSNYRVMEDGIRNSMNIYYSSMRNFEIDMKDKIKNILNNINNDFNNQKTNDKYNELKLVCNGFKGKILSNVIDLINKYDLDLNDVLIESELEQCWHIKSNNNLIGIISWDKTTIDINITYPNKISVTFTNKTNNKININILDNIFKSIQI
jgi:hypothetical protein